jgi:hypothetical protein
MVLALIAGGLLVALAVVAWLVRMALPSRSAAHVRTVNRQKRDVLREIHAEGLATRERIRDASRNGPPGQRAGQRRAGHAGRSRSRPPGIGQPRRSARWPLVVGALLIVAAGITAVALVRAPRAAIARPAAPSRLDMLRRTIQAAQVGECVNFTGDVAQSSAPADPGIVQCAYPAATFKVVWLGPSRREDPCPAQFLNPKWWSDGAGKVACMIRIYHVGQCMAGPPTKDGRVTWYYNAVVPCSLPPGPGYAYVVRVLGIVAAGSGRCPAGSYVQRGPDDDLGISICIGLLN